MRIGVPIAALLLVSVGCGTNGTAGGAAGGGGIGGSAGAGGVGGVDGGAGVGGMGGSAGTGGAGGVGGSAGAGGIGGSGGTAGAAGMGGTGGTGGAAGMGGTGGTGGGASLCPEGTIDVYGDGLNCRCDCAAGCPEPDCGCSEPLRFLNDSNSMTIDCITPDVCLTRNTGGPLINVPLETVHDQFQSPLGTKWAPTICAHAGDDDFVPFNESMDFLVVQRILTTPLCMFLEEAKLKYDVMFLAWERSNQGGAFEYIRTPYYADECGHADALCEPVCGCPEGFVPDPESGMCRLMGVAPGP